MEKFIPNACKELNLRYSILEDQFDTSKIYSIYELENDNSLDLLFIKLPYPITSDISNDMIELMDYSIKNEIPVITILYPIYMETTLVAHF